jgi:hypothetical protein
VVRAGGPTRPRGRLRRPGSRKIAGVKVVRDGDFLGVVAPDEATAGRAASLVRAEWRAEDS